MIVILEMRLSSVGNPVIIGVGISLKRGLYQKGNAVVEFLT